MSPAPKHSWFKSGLRFCGSCAVTLTCWALWLVLGALIAVLLYVALAKELPVPGYVLRRIEGELARSGLILSFGRARFDPTGKVLLQDVRLRTSQFEDPLLTCRLLYVRHDFMLLLSGWNFPEEIQIEGAALQLPAMLAPGGTAEPVIRDLAVTLRRRDHAWRIEQFAGRLGRLSLSLQGEFTPPRAAGAAPDLQKLTGQFLQFARRLAPFADRLEAFVFDRVTEGGAEDAAHDFFLDLFGETRAHDRGRDLAGTEAGDFGVAAEFVRDAVGLARQNGRGDLDFHGLLDGREVFEVQYGHGSRCARKLRIENEE